MHKPLPVFLLLVCLSLPLFSDDATMFRGNPEHSGVYDAAGVTTFHRLKWKFHTGGMVISSPAVAGGIVYLGSSDGNFYAVDAESGAQKWKFEIRSRVPSSPAVSGGVVYFGAYDGNFYALDAASGKLNWKFKTGDVVHASPAIADDTVFIGSWDSYFYAIETGTGRERWRFKTGEDPDTHNQVGIRSSASVADGIVYFGCRDSNFYALDAKSGEKKWVYGNKGSWVVSSPAVKDGKVYFVTSDSSLLYALDAKSGQVQHAVNFNHWYLYSSPAIAGGALYFGSTQGKLFSVDLADFKTRWSFETEGSKKNGATYTKPDGTPNESALYHSDFYDDIVAGVDRVMSMGSILSSPVVVGNVVYVSSADGNLYALM